MSLLRLIVLVLFFAPSDQKTYSCNPNTECGCSMKPASVARIVNGENAEVDSWGWMVSLSLGGGTYSCGGSIISSSWILTAAHCVYHFSASGTTVYAGSSRNWVGTQNRTVSKIIIHSDYKPRTWENDIALLKLATPFDMDDPHLATICIPSVNVSASDNNEWPAAETTVIATGWGRLAEEADVSEKLQQVTLQTVDYRSPKCNSTIYNRHLQFCAGVADDSKDTCEGDSGGPLMMFTSRKQWALVGLTSYGNGCAQKGYAGVYTRVAVYENWIKLNTNQSYTKTTSFEKYVHLSIDSSANAIITKNYYQFLGVFVFFLSLLVNL